jgi:REP element-mobilizing transposase RayT
MKEIASHNRRSIRLHGYDYSQDGLYFVTICVQNKASLLGEIMEGEMVLNDAGKMVEKQWLALSAHFKNIVLHEYIVMPNHFHGIIEIIDNVGAGSARPDNIPDSGIGRATPAPTVGNIIGYFKYLTTKEIDLPVKLWQRNYYEHIIRDEQSHDNIAGYIIENPFYWVTDNYYVD